MGDEYNLLPPRASGNGRAGGVVWNGDALSPSSGGVGVGLDDRFREVDCARDKPIGHVGYGAFITYCFTGSPLPSLCLL